MRSGEFMKYNRWNRNPNEDAEFALEVRKHYAACVSFADAQVGRVMEKLKDTGSAKNTIVILWGDHGWHLGEHAVWGKHTLFEESLRSPLIVSYPGIDETGRTQPTRWSNLWMCFPPCAIWRDFLGPILSTEFRLRPLLEDPASPGHPAISYGRRSKNDSHRHASPDRSQ